MKQEISLSQLFKLIPEEVLERIRTDTKVDYQAKKLTGKVLLQLLLFALLENGNVSLRIIEEIYSSQKFKIFADKEGDRTRIKYNSLSDRLASIPSNYFREIFEFLVKTYEEEIKKNSKENIIRFDSTMVGLSSKLLKEGMRNSQKIFKTKHIKYSIGFGDIPMSAKMYKQQEEISEEVALRKAILESSHDQKNIVVFDRGLKRRKTLQEFDTRNIQFVTRANQKIRYKKVSVHKDIRGRKSLNLQFQEDLIVHLKNEKEKWIKEKFRLITAIQKRNKEEISFLTNITDLNAREITDLYKKRWEIEIFFKFIKQHLHFSHFFSRTANGVQVMLYCTLILSILLLMYKKKRYKKL